MAAKKWIAGEKAFFVCGDYRPRTVEVLADQGNDGVSCHWLDDQGGYQRAVLPARCLKRFEEAMPEESSPTIASR